jgi:hypothetical protein
VEVWEVQNKSRINATEIDFWRTVDSRLEIRLFTKNRNCTRNCNKRIEERQHSMDTNDKYRILKWKPAERRKCKTDC